MNIIKNKVVSWGVRGVIIGFILIFVPGGLNIAFWPLFLASKVTGNSSDFVSTAGFFGIPNLAGTIILAVGWFIIGAVIGWLIERFSKKA